MPRLSLAPGLALALAGALVASLAEAPGAGLALAAVGLALAAAGLARIAVPRGEEAADRAPLYTMNTLLHALLVGGCVVAVNVLAARHPLLHDLTANRRFTLSPQTLGVLAALPREAEITAFYAETDGARQALEDLLALYRAAQPRVRASFADMNRKPDLASRHGVTAERTLVVESGGRVEKLRGVPDETDVTNALLRVTRDRPTRVVFTSGRGERPLSGDGHGDLSRLKEMLGEAGFACETRLFGEGPAPAADIVAVVGPKAPFSATAEAALAAFVEGGGSLLVCLDPPPGAGLEGLLERFGIATTDAVVVDRSAEHPLVPVVVPLARHPAAGDANVACVFPLARIVGPAAAAPEGWRVEPLLVTGREAYAKVGLAGAGAAFDPKRDFPGPVPFGVTAERPGEEGRPAGRVAAVGNAAFLGNGTLHAQGTYLLARGLFGWLAARPELAGLDERPWSAQAIRLTPRDRWAVFWITLVLVPAALAALGVAAHLRGRG